MKKNKKIKRPLDFFATPSTLFQEFAKNLKA
jgi:hypothetical protein